MNLSMCPYCMTGCMPTRGITGSSGSGMSSFLRNHQTVFHIGCTSLQYLQKWRSVPFLYISPKTWCILIFFILAILKGLRWNLRVVLICLSLMINDGEHFLRWFSAIQKSSGENYFISTVPIFNRVIWLPGV